LTSFKKTSNNKTHGDRSLFLGMDAGAVAVSVVCIDRTGELVEHIYRPHLGKPAECLYNILSSFDLSRIAAAARTSGTPKVLSGAREYDSHVAIIAGCKSRFPYLASILHVGGEKFVLIRFDKNGNYRGLRTNTSCAAGTGGFLDQQAKRMSLKDSAELSRLALSNRGETPGIASRCSVFAKTDIIHRQQEGYSLEEICDGLCLGLANNIADTLDLKDKGLSPVVFSGGVSLNGAVLKHLRRISGQEIQVPDNSHILAAIGVVQLLIEENIPAQDLFLQRPGFTEKEYFYPPLVVTLSNYPDFNGIVHRDMKVSGGAGIIECDLYRKSETADLKDIYMGIDIGSTSSKAIIIDKEKRPIAGFYTRTAGRPIIAVQGIFEAAVRFLQQNGNKLFFKAVATTGSGRKFIGKIIAADCILDEISAHARAAIELDPEIDTIIEIGGQDAKFTTLRKGVVTFSKMNTVCAAGTGSFIEEQAQKLDVPLGKFAEYATGARAPLASDRCTVFMERDINHYLNKNYSVNEILAAVLFSVRENYLQKVASGGSIGNRICFQGATAKNKALVAAFEQKLQQPVYVSKYCHLTGALGAAITALEEHKGKSSFRGINIYNEHIPVRTETCELCLNHCRIRIAHVQNEDVAYGFLCGRDYETKHFVRKEIVPPLKQMRQSVFSKTPKPAIAKPLACIGIPAGLQILEEMPFWRTFFHSLGFRVITSENEKDILRIGKSCTGAEFCAPMTAFHGHVRSLAENCDVLFLPIHLEGEKDPDNPKRLRKYCYYTQFSTVITSLMKPDGRQIKSLRPLINHRHNPLYTKAELFNAIQKAFPDTVTPVSVNRAYDEAQSYYRNIKSGMKEIYTPPGDDEIAVALLGRPYTVLPDNMNNGIPSYFAQLGVPCYFMDSLPVAEKDTDMENLLDLIHWAYPAAIMEAANLCIRTPGLYPVFITSFKCAPDSFALEYFKRLMDTAGKPYLILQLDEHDSNVGYETRIEAGVRAFRNHLKSNGKISCRTLPVAPSFENDIKGKTLLLPNWDPLVIPLVAANLRAAGVDARVLEETPRLIAESMKMNTGQCIPVNAIAHEFIEYIKKYDLNPAKTRLWMVRGGWACNIPMYSSYIKTLINETPGMEHAGVYNGNIAMVDFSPIVSVKTYFAYMFGGNLKKIGCMIRPYEINKGETDRVLKECRDVLESAFLGNMRYMDAVKISIEKLDAIRINKTKRPKVAIFGDLYVRDNEVMNQDLIHVIEDAGGEVVVTPYNDYAKIIVGAHFKKWIRELYLSGLVIYRSLLAAMQLMESRYQSYFSKYVGTPLSARNPDAVKELGQFNIRVEQEGESYENILKIFRIVKEHPDISLFIQANPAFCCPSLITEAMCKDIEEITGIPVLTITYDGTETPKNDILIPYLKYASSAVGNKSDHEEIYENV